MSPDLVVTFIRHIPVFRYDGLNGSFFFIKVQAIAKNLVASFTRILVPMPFSLSRPFRMLGVLWTGIHILINR
jgi:hypothetical protein